MELSRQAIRLAAMDDVETMLEAVRKAVLKGNSGFLENEHARAQLEGALRRLQARQDEFSLRATNARFHRNEHRVLMHLQW